MKAEELANRIFSDKEKKDQFVSAIARWRKVQEKFDENVKLLEKDSAAKAESVPRLRSSLIRLVNETTNTRVVDKLFEAISGGGEAEDEIAITEKADRLEGWAKSARPEDIRKLGQEAIVGEDERVPVEFFERAQVASRSIGRIDVGGTPKGTGFFAGNGIVATNWHVLPDLIHAAAGEILFNFEENLTGAALNHEIFRFDPARFYYANKELDIAFVSTKMHSNERKTPASSFGHIPFIEGEGKIVIGKCVNVVQHPNGGAKVVSFRNGRLVEVRNFHGKDHFCYYTADTEPGSSGSPVFNDRWQLIAIHHHAFPNMDKNGKILDKDGKQISEAKAEANPDLVHWVANEGTRVSRIVNHLKNVEVGDAGISNEGTAEIRDDLIELWAEE